MPDKVIFDTNPIRNTDSKNFLGGRDELVKFSKIADLIIPDIVIEEVKEQKRRNLKGKKKAFLDNPFHWLRQVDHDETSNFDIESHITDLEKAEELKYNLIELTDYSVLGKMKELALKKCPPFSKESTDKGFKDAYIYFTILEYLKQNPEENIYFVTADGRLKESLTEESRITLIKDFKEFQEKRFSFLKDEYFINNLKNLTEEEFIMIEDSDWGKMEAWHNINGNYTIKIGSNYIEIDYSTKEPIEYFSKENIKIYFVNDSKFKDTIQDLISSGSFRMTHQTISELKHHTRYISDKNIEQLLNAFLENPQVHHISDDEDVKEFFLSIYIPKKNIINKENQKAFEKHFPNILLENTPEEIDFLSF